MTVFLLVVSGILLVLIGLQIWQIGWLKTRLGELSSEIAPQIKDKVSESLNKPFLDITERLSRNFADTQERLDRTLG